MLFVNTCLHRWRNLIFRRVRKHRLIWISILFSFLYIIHTLSIAKTHPEKMGIDPVESYWDTTRSLSLGLHDFQFDFRKFYEDLDHQKYSISEYDFTENFLNRIHHARLMSSQPFRFVQIGASRGFEWNDPISSVKNSSISYGLMVEPVPNNVKALTHQLNEAKLINNIKPILAAAGCEAHTQQDFYMVSKFYGAAFPSASDWNKFQVGSFNRDHVVAHLCFPGAVAEGSKYWKYIEKECGYSYTLRNSYCWNCNIASILQECTVNPECGSVALTGVSLFGLMKIFTRVKYGTIECMANKDTIVETRHKFHSSDSASSDDTVLFVKRSEEHDRECPAHKFIVNSPVDCFPGWQVLDQWREFGNQLASCVTSRRVPVAGGDPQPHSSESESESFGSKALSPSDKGMLNCGVRNWAGGGMGVDVLMIDVEGWDLAVLQTLHIGKHEVFPWIIIFETQHLSVDDKREAKALLEKNNYIVFDLAPGNSGNGVRNTAAVARVLPDLLSNA